MSYLGSYLLVAFLLLCMVHHDHYGIEKVHILMLRNFSEKKLQSWKARDLLAGDLGRDNGVHFSIAVSAATENDVMNLFLTNCRSINFLGLDW